MTVEVGLLQVDKRRIFERAEHVAPAHVSPGHQRSRTHGAVHRQRHGRMALGRQHHRPVERGLVGHGRGPRNGVGLQGAVLRLDRPGNRAVRERLCRFGRCRGCRMAAGAAQGNQGKNYFFHGAVIIFGYRYSSYSSAATLWLYTASAYPRRISNALFRLWINSGIPVSLFFNCNVAERISASASGRAVEV